MKTCSRECQAEGCLIGVDKMKSQEIKNEILIGDCLEVMAKLPDNSIDLVVTSPPYADARAHTYGGVKPAEYVNWFAPRAEQIYRILKPTGSFVLNIKEKAINGERSLYVLDLISHLKKETGYLWIEEYIWHKTTSMPGKWKYRFRDAWERIIHFAKSKDIKMNQQAVMQPVSDWTQQRLTNMNENDLSRQKSNTNPKTGRRISAWVGRDKVYPSNVLHRAPICHNTGHSAAFPDWLPKFFIELFTDSGDIVLDPFSGSRTTFRVAQSLGRIGVGIEIKAEYVNK